MKKNDINIVENFKMNSDIIKYIRKSVNYIPSLSCLIIAKMVYVHIF